MSTLPAFQKLTEVAKKLNDESDKINKLIERFQDKLNSLNVGLEVWLERDPLEEWREEDDEEVSNETWGERTPAEEEPKIYKRLLGYTKSYDGWAVSVKTIAEYYDHKGRFQSIDVANSEIELLKESREIRLESVTLFPQLLEEITARAEGLITQVSTIESKLNLK